MEKTDIKWVTAPSYRDYETIGSPYVKNNKMYAKVRKICDRCCHGVYVCRVENGQPVPHPAYGGVCLKCGGTGFITKEVRLYTEAEAEKMEAANQRAREKKEEERREKMVREYAQKKSEWLKYHGFTEDGFTYIITGDSYSIKDELKENGWRFDTVLLWHKADPAGYEERTIKVDVNEVFSFSAWGEGTYKTNAYQIVRDLLKPTKEPCYSQYVGTIGERCFFDVTLKSKISFEGRYGLTTAVTFETKEGNLLTWFTSTTVNAEVGDALFITGTIKSHDLYKDNQVTYITRVKIKEAK